ncbi:putative anti-sigmaE protein [Luteitalea pratensis]|uniref:Regulator of SigK n=1 Tax=Luteitalea pratensis TaxID=1855912 RepID=A0A143PYE3_LUTPR|nr:anti-sigma factor [Luteitalea pratensis]AMY12819.1 putative anti-sigmaE protein [Luteitalea pratensis]
MTSSGTDPRYDALAELALGTLPESERPAIEAWLAGDPDALAEFRALRESLGLLALAAPVVEPPASLRDRVLAVTGHAVDRGHTPATTRTAVPIGVDFPPKSSGPVVGSGLSVGWLAAAAAAILALGLGVYALQLRSQVERLQADLDATAARLATTEAEARVNRTRLARAQAETSILTAADLRRVDLAGQKGAPRAAARAFWSRAQGLVLTATRLPDLPEGRTYQLWVLTSGAPISAGIFRPDASGGTSIVFDTPVSLPPPAGMAVSVEPAGGVPAPTGEIVLIGKAD